MGGMPITTGNEAVQFPGARVNLSLGNVPGSGESVGSVVNHVGFSVKNVQEQVAQWKAKGVPVLPGNNNRLDQAFVVTPDGVRIEILEDKTQTMPIRHEHVHFSLPEAEIPKAQAWYAKTFGGKAGTRNNASVVDIPGGQLRFAKADAAQAPTKGRVLDYIGFDVKDLQAFVKKVGAEGSGPGASDRWSSGGPAEERRKNLACRGGKETLAQESACQTDGKLHSD
jgi:hypothetical protein